MLFISIFQTVTQIYPHPSISDKSITFETRFLTLLNYEQYISTIPFIILVVL